jgi:predicted SprT family Zn-dependent metalloprotease
MMRQLDFLARLLARPFRGENTRPSGFDQVLAERCAALLQPLGAEQLARLVRVQWSARLRSTAGMAYPARALIRLNPRLRDFGAEEVDRTLRHELAHLLAQHRAGRRRIAPHGVEWRRACRDLGLDDERRCHDLPLPRRTVARPHRYRCPACALEFNRTRPLRRPSACLACCRRHSDGRYDERFRLVKVRS